MAGRASWLKVERTVSEVFRDDWRIQEKGQGTLEAALTLPILFCLLLLLIQPGIILYDRTIMSSAAAEGCRVLLTQTNALGDGTASTEAFVRHRLAAIPAQENFHVHDGGCSWSIALEGAEDDPWVAVSIKNEVKPLPLIAYGATLLGMTNDRGNVELSVTQRLQAQPSWATAKGLPVSSWAGGWQS